MVGRNTIDGAVRQRFSEGLTVCLLSKGWVDLAIGVVTEEGLVGEEQMMRRHFGGHTQAAGLRLPNQSNRTEARNVRDVIPGARHFGQDQVPRDDDVLRCAGPTS